MGPGIPGRSVLPRLVTRRRAPLVALVTALVVTPLVVPAADAAPARSAPTRSTTVSAAADEPLLEITGPTEVALARVVHLAAVGLAVTDDATFAWDLDGDGSYETATGSEPSVDFDFTEAGPQEVGVQVSNSRTAPTARLAIDVQRPPTASIQVTPAYAGPGDTVTLSMATRADEGDFVGFTWSVEGVKPTRTSAPLLAAETPTRRAAQAPYAGPEPYLSTAGTPFSATTEPAIEVTLPKGGSRIGDTVTIVGKALAPDGDIVVAKRFLKLSSGRKGTVTEPYPKNKVVDCTTMPGGVPSYPCAQFSVSGDLAAGYSTYFANTSSTVEACAPGFESDGNAPLAAAKLKERKNLPYPAPEAFTLDGFTVGGPGPGGRRAPTQDCFTVRGKTISWSWGDGGPDSPGYDGIGHVFAEPGTYPVTMTTTVPYFLSAGQKLFSDVKYFTAKATQQVTVLEPDCEVKTLNGLPAIPSNGKADACWIVTEGSDLLRPPAGYGVRLAGLQLDQVGSVDPASATIVGKPGAGGIDASAFLPDADGNPVRRTVLENSPSLILPAPTDQGFGAPVTALPAGPPVAFLTSFKGLDVASVQTFLSPAEPPRVALSMVVPEPLNGKTPVAVLPGFAPPGTAAADGSRRRASAGDLAVQNLPPGTDFGIDLSNTRMGLFDLKSPTFLYHRTSGGWYASAVIGVDGLGDLVAEYKPPGGGSSPRCAEVTGPSGLDLTAGGGFNFGGATWLPPSGFSIGPLGLNCVAISASAGGTDGSLKPFVVEGKASFDVPVGGPISIDACLGAAVLGGGQKADACGRGWTAPSDAVWFTATGEVSLFDFLPLANAFVETRYAQDLFSTQLGGGVEFDIGPFSLTATVQGTVQVRNGEGAFDLIGQAELCAFILCPSVQAGVSSVGFGACARSIGGFVYRWGDGVEFFVASCDLKAKIGVQSRVSRLASAPGTAVAVPTGLERAAFAVEKVDGAGAPRVRLRSPSGKVFLDNGDALQRRKGYTIVRYDDPDEGLATTTVTIENPERGRWTVEDVDGSRVSTDLYTPIRDPKVSGSVVGSGARRTLSYDAGLAPGDSLVFTETGRSGPRVIGRTKNDDGTIAIPRAGAAGTRTVTATVIRNGIPYRTFTLDSYQAPAGLNLAPPSQVTLTDAGTGLRVTWPAVPGADGYEVRARTTDGRIVSTSSTDRSVVLPGVGTIAAGSVSVVAVGPAGTSSDPRQAALTPRKRVFVRP